MTEGNLIEQVAVKTHSGWTGSYAVRKTAAIATTDATTTVIASVAIPSGYVATIRTLVSAGQSGAADASAFTGLCAIANAAGTTAVKGTALYQVVESDAATNHTITANDTTDSAEINVIGINAENWFWVVQYEVIFNPLSAS